MTGSRVGGSTHKSQVSCKLAKDLPGGPGRGSTGSSPRAPRPRTTYIWHCEDHAAHKRRRGRSFAARARRSWLQGRAGGWGAAPGAAARLSQAQPTHQRHTVTSNNTTRRSPAVPRATQGRPCGKATAAAQSRGTESRRHLRPGCDVQSRRRRRRSQARCTWASWVASRQRRRRPGRGMQAHCRRRCR